MLYTKTGDNGETGLFDGTRVSKADPRVEAYGDVDELNAWLGLVRAHAPEPRSTASSSRSKRDSFALGSMLADPQHRIAGRVQKATLDQGRITKLEQWIDAMESSAPPLRHFVLAGGIPGAAMLHLARAVCRRAERRIVSLGTDAVPPVVVIYMNRLSDLLFAMARVANARAGAHETEW